MATAIQARLVEAPGGGIIRNVDPRHVPDTAFSNGRNIRFPTGGTRVRTTDGFLKVDEATPQEPVLAIWWYVPPFGDARLVRITPTSATIGLKEFREEIVSYPPGSVTDLDHVVTLDQYQEFLIWSTGGTDVWVWDGTADPAVLLNTKTHLDTVTGLPVLSGSPTGKLIEIHKEHVLIGNITDDGTEDHVKRPWGLQFSRPANPFDWTSDIAGDINFLDDSTELMALKVLGDHVIVHKPNRLYRMIYVGQPDLYIIEGIPADDGAISARAPLSLGAYQYYMGRTNFYRLASFAEPIGDAIWPEVQASIDWDKAHLIYAYRRLEWDEICWKIPTRGSAQPDLTVVYNFRNQTWSLTDHDPGLCFTEVPTTVFAAELHQANAPPVRGTFGQVNGDIHVYGGVNSRDDASDEPIHAWVESKHFTDGLTPNKILAVPVFATGQGTLQVTLRAAMEARAPMPPWGASQPIVLDPSQTRPWIDARAYGRLWQVRMESNELDTAWEVSAYGAAVVPGAYAR